MLLSAFAVLKNAVSRELFSPRSGWRMAAASALTVCVLAGVELQAQTAHLGNIVTLGSGFANPFTVAVDPSGNVYVTDYGNHAVKEIEAAGGYTTVRTLVGGVSFIFGSAVDASGDVFFSEYGKNHVDEILAENGVIPPSPKVIILGSGFNIPAGVALDASGNIFVGDQNNNAVKEILASGGYTTTITVATGFTVPDGVAVDKYGNVFVANDGGNSVEEIEAVNGVIPPSPTIVTLGSGFSQPFDVAVDGGGNVYVADRGNNAVKEIMAVNGVIPASPVINTLGSGFSTPTGVAVDASGNVYVADNGNSAVKEIQKLGANFGQDPVGTTTAALPVTFTFDTGGTLGSYAVLTFGDAGMDFQDAGGGSCVANTVYSAGATCTVNVKFDPLAPGPRYGAVELLSTTGTVLASGPLQGIGTGPQATFAVTTSGVSFPSSTFNTGSGFSGPAGAAVDANGNIFVSDSFNAAVKEILASGGWTTIKSLGGTFGFDYPNGVALDGGGNVYVADTLNDAVEEIVAAGGYATVNTLGWGFSTPYSVAVDGLGNVYVADFGNDAVKEILAVGGSIPASPSILTLASGLHGPDGVAVDGNGNVFVAVYRDGTVLEIQAVNGSVPASPVITTIGSGFSGPANLSVDAAGNVFVSDTDGGKVIELVAAGGYTSQRVLGGTFSAPEATAVWQNGDVIVADAGTNLVQLLDYNDTPSLTFASTPEGSTSSDSPRTVVMQNDGNQPLNLSGLSYPADFPEDTAAGGSETLCTSTSSLGAGQVCYLPVNFTPAHVGTLNESLTITDNTLNLSAAKQSIALSGTGTTGAPPSVSLSPAKLAFGTVATSKTLAVTIKNLGTTALTFSQAPTITGTGMAKFSVLPYKASPATSTCLNPALTSLAQNATCTYSVEFNNAGATTAAAANLNIFDSGAGSPQVEPLTGTGTEVSLSPAKLAFGTVATSKTLAVTIKNLGTTALTFSQAPTVTGTGAANFAVLPYSAPSTSTCLNPSLTSLAQNATCTYSVTFTNAGGTTSFTTELNIFDNGGGSPQLEAMTATD